MRVVFFASLVPFIDACKEMFSPSTCFRAWSKHASSGSDGSRKLGELMAHQGISWAIFLDLDETLVFTSRIESLRRKRLWEEAKRSFHFTSLPPGTQQFLQHAR